MVFTNGRISSPPPRLKFFPLLRSSESFRLQIRLYNRQFLDTSFSARAEHLHLKALKLDFQFHQKLRPHRGSTPTQRSFDSTPLSVWTWPLVVRGHPDGPVYRLPWFRCQRHTGQLCSNPLVFTVHSKKIQKYLPDNSRWKPLVLITRGTNHNHCLWGKEKAPNANLR